MPSSISSSEPLPLARKPAEPEPEAEIASAPDDGLIAADALEEAHRIIPERPWGKIALAALAMTVALVAVWEGYWRYRMYEPGDMKNSASAWAQERRRAVGGATVLIGSSRNFFNVDLGVWEQAVGVRPIQLSLEGTSPRFALTDLADDPKFRGVVIADMSTPQFFATAGGRRADVLAYTRDQTPSQRVGHLLTNAFDAGFAFLDDQTRPREIWFNQWLPPRQGQRPRRDPFKIQVMAPDRNAEMWRRMVEDRSYQAEAIAVWPMMPGRDTPPPTEAQRREVIGEVRRNVEKIRAKGGDVIFVFHPVEGLFLKVESGPFHRSRYFDRLVSETGTIGVHYLDHPQLQGYRLPETSHLHPRDAEVYTAHLARILAAEQARRRAQGDR
jgi:hypothetical protein